MQYITNITLPVSGEKSYISVPAKQGDGGTRFISVTLDDNGSTFTVPAGATATISMTKPDGTSVFNAAEISSNTITAELTTQMLALPGRAYCDINLFAQDGSLLSSSGFNLVIEKSARNNQAVESSNEFTALQQALADVSQGGGSGSDGKSAYEIAVENGYEGTETEWLASLKGEQGIQGPQGPAGPAGADAPASVDVSGILYGKTILDFGDSIAYGNDTAGVGYADMIAERNGMSVHSYAVGGHKLSQILAQLQGATEETADYVLLEGGYNDANPSALTPMGTLSSGYTATLDTSTFYGALETLLKTAQTKYPSAKTVYVIVHRTKRTQWPDYAAAIKSACDKWSVPCVNLMEQGGLNSNVDAMLNAYTDSVGVHPNESGYLTWYVPPIEAKLRELTSHVVQTSDPVTPDAPYTGTFNIPGVIPDNVQKISQYTVDGLSLVEGSMTAGTQEIALPALGKWDVLTASADGSGTIARQSAKRLLSSFTWNLISSNDTTLYFGCTTSGQYLSAADLPANDGAELTCVYSPDFTPSTVSSMANATTEGIAFKSTGSPRLRVLASRLTDAGYTADLAGLNSYLAATGNYIVYKATEQTSESVTLDALTATSGAVSLTDGYSGGTMTAVEDAPGGDAGGNSLPDVTADDNGKVLGVVDGAWDKMDIPGDKPWTLIADETPEVDTAWFTWTADAEGNSFDFTDILIVSDSASVFSAFTKFFAVETTTNTEPTYASMYKSVTAGKQVYIYVQKLGSKTLLLCGGQDQSMISTINTPSDDHYTTLTAYFQSGWKAGYNFKVYGR